MQLFPKPLTRPKPMPPKRITVGRRMTIALGVLASDGVVIAADAQETYGDYFKTFALKVHSAMTHSNIHSNVKSAVVVTGAGPGVYLDAVAHRIIHAFHQNQDTRIGDFEAHLEEFLKGFWAEHVTPLQPHTDRQFELIVGAEIEGQRGLWLTDGNLIRPSAGFEAAGTGRSYARMAVQRYAINLGAQSAALLAVLGVMQAREYDNYCGKGTSVTFIKENRTYTLPWFQIEEAEKLFRKYAGFDHSAFVHAVVSDQTEDPKRVQNLSRLLTEMRNEFTTLAAAFLEHPD
jgi:ATP-dependent protease HslVU (ClpYQ) peptidase subunit